MKKRGLIILKNKGIYDYLLSKISQKALGCLRWEMNNWQKDLHSISRINVLKLVKIYTSYRIGSIYYEISKKW